MSLLTAIGRAVQAGGITAALIVAAGLGILAGWAIRGRSGQPFITDEDLSLCPVCDDGSWFLDCTCEGTGCGKPNCPVGRFNQAMFGWLDALEAEGSGEHG